MPPHCSRRRSKPRHLKSNGSDVEELRRICDMLRLDRKGNKSDLQQRIKKYEKDATSGTRDSTTIRCPGCKDVVTNATYCIRCRFVELEPFQDAICLQYRNVVEGSSSFCTPNANDGRLELRCLKVEHDRRDEAKLLVEAWPKSGVQIFRRDIEPLQVEPHKRLMPPLPLKIQLRVVMKAEESRELCIGLMSIRPKKDIQALQEGIRARLRSQMLSVDARLISSSRFREKFLKSGGVELDAKCPYTMCKIITAVRSKHCSHAQCFDLDAHLSCAAQTATSDLMPYVRRWACPLCGVSARPAELEPDAFVQDIISGMSGSRVYVSVDLSVSRVGMQAVDIEL